MSRDRTSLTAKPAFERRPASSSAVQGSVPEGARSPARSIQQRLGNRASQILISRSAATRSSASGEKSEPVNSTVPAAPQFSKWTRLPAKVSKPIDPAELEAEDTARKVMRMGTKGSTPNVQGASKASVQREKSQPQAAPAKTSTTPNMSSGAPLPTPVRRQMEPRFGADFGNVRVHTDQAAAKQSEAFSANAFTVGQNIFFGRDKFQPQSASGQQLIAHELTHTIQQGAAVQRSADTTVSEQSQPHVQRQAAAPGKKGDAAEQRTISSQVVDLSSGTFNPSQTVRDEIEATGYKGLMVRVAHKGLGKEGQVKVRADRSKQFDSAAPGSMPLINAWTDELGGMYLTFNVKDSKVSGHASLKPGGGNPSAWLDTVKKNASLLGGVGLKVQGLPKTVNKYEGGKLTMSVNAMKVEVGGFLDAGFDIVLENSQTPKICATADVKIKGMANGQLVLDNSQGRLAGQATIAIELKAFSGAVTVKYLPDGTVDIQGKAAYSADKLSGEITFIATDLDTANRFAKDAIAAAGGKNNVQEAPPPAPVPAPKPGKKTRGLAAAGQLKFNLTKWFAGTVNVVVDAKGDVTVIGKIAPPAEIPLFDQKSWDKELVKFEAKAYYGIPVVGNLNLFANISLHALADLGPAKIYNIEVLGTYSTDPEIQKNIQISGSINISAYAGLRLRAEGGAGIEILSHDLKFGIGINADVGVKAYADARPTIGYRDPGEFYISGTLEMVAQPMLGLSGEFFIMLDAPWWSPLDDDKWAWPLFSKEWPLTDPIGINASVKEYVLGSGKVPEIELKKPEFDPSKFMTNMVDRKLPDKSGGAGKGQGSFKEDGSVPKPVVPPKKPAPPKPPPKPGKKGAAPGVGKSAKPDEKGNAELAAAKALKAGLDGLKSKQPYSKDELTKALGALKGKVKGVSFTSKPQGDKWIVTATGGGKKKSSGQSIELTMKKEGAVSDKAQKGLAALDQVTERYAAAGATLEEMTTAVKSVRRNPNFGFKSITLEQKDGFWYFNYEINPKGKKRSASVKKKAEETGATLNLVVLSKHFIAKDKKAKGKKLAMTADELIRQVKIQEAALNKLSVENWWKNWTRFYPQDRRPEDVGDEDMEGGRFDEAAASKERERLISEERSKVVTLWLKNNPGKSVADANDFADELFKRRPDDKAYPFMYKSRDSNGITYVNPVYGKTLLHGADQAAGGGAGTAGLGGARENFSIGAQWQVGRGDRATVLKGQLLAEIARAEKAADRASVQKMNLKVELPVKTEKVDK